MAEEKTIEVSVLSKEESIRQTLAIVTSAIQERGMDPIKQMTEYLISDDPTFITSHNRARSLICKIPRTAILEALLNAYLGNS